MSFTLNDIPDDVLTVWAMEISYQMTGVGYGKEMIDWVKSIVEKYPEWFPEDEEQEIFPTKKD